MLEVAHVDDYPTVDDIVYGMGDILGRLHWCGGYDGRDVEFIMGGASFSGVAMNIIRCVPGRGRRMKYISLLKLSSAMILIILALALKTPSIRNFASVTWRHTQRSLKKLPRLPRSFYARLKQNKPNVILLQTLVVTNDMNGLKRYPEIYFNT
jgi:hypothetical protein